MQIFSGAGASSSRLSIGLAENLHLNLSDTIADALSSLRYLMHVACPSLSREISVDGAGEKKIKKRASLSNL